jgi:hypothetical protein
LSSARLVINPGFFLSSAYLRWSDILKWNLKIKPTDIHPKIILVCKDYWLICAKEGRTIFDPALIGHKRYSKIADRISLFYKLSFTNNESSSNAIPSTLCWEGEVGEGGLFPKLMSGWQDHILGESNLGWKGYPACGM